MAVSPQELDTPACILGSGITALGVLRLLGSAGIPSVCVSDVRGIEAASRFFRPARDGGGAELKLTNFRMESLRGIVEKLGKKSFVYIPCNDHALAAIAELNEGLAPAERILSSVPPLEAIKSCTDKALCASMLQRFSVPHPRTLSAEQAVRGGEGGTSEFFLKPTDSQAFFREFGVKAYRVSGSEELERRLSEIHARGLSAVVQEYIPGAATAHVYVEGFIDRNGVERAACARRRLRMFPPDFGNSTSMVSIELAEVRSAHEDLKRLLQGINYRGVYSAEFKYDARDGAFKLIEINARPWWYIEFIGSCGINIAEMIYRDALEQPVPDATRFEIGKRVSYLYYDLFAVRLLRSSSNCSWPEIFQDWCRSGFVIWSWGDLWPGISSSLGCLSSWIRGRMKSGGG